MNEKIKITTAATEELLSSLYGQQTYHVQALGEGVWSYAYSFEREMVKYVIRFGDVPDNFERDAFAAGFSSPDLPIPQIFAIGKAGDAFYAISSFVAGEFLEQLPPGKIIAATPSLLKSLRALRSIEISLTTKGYGFFDQHGVGSHDSWKAFLLDDKNESKGSLIRGWKEVLQKSEMGMAAYDKLWSKFQSLIEYCPEDKRLVHSDTVNRNVLVENDKVTAVLDWGSAFFGDPLYEIAWIKFCEPWSPHFKSAQVVEKLMDDYRSDPNANQKYLDERMQCYLLNIAAGSITYNAFRGDWKVAQEIVEYANKLFG